MVEAQAALQASAEEEKQDPEPYTTFFFTLSNFDSPLLKQVVCFKLDKEPILIDLADQELTNEYWYSCQTSESELF